MNFEIFPSSRSQTVYTELTEMENCLCGESCGRVVKVEAAARMDKPLLMWVAAAVWPAGSGVGSGGVVVQRGCSVLPSLALWNPRPHNYL